MHGGPIAPLEFDSWHEKNTLALTEAQSELQVGWAAKMLNIYLKTRCYLAGEGRPNLAACLHPPIDNMLWTAFRKEYAHDSEVSGRLHLFTRIKDIATYPQYRDLIEVCRLIAKKPSCLLIEVEELWPGTTG